MRTIWLAVLGVGMAINLPGGPGRTAAAQDFRPGGLRSGPSERPDQLGGRELIEQLISHEADAGKHRGFYTYLNVERSDRTGGHQWTERVTETSWGKVRYLIAEDGKPLSPQRESAERARMEDDAAHPDAFRQRESARSEDEQHMRQMLVLLPKAFLFDAPLPEGDCFRVHYRPNPNYQPASLEERVLHSMSGSVLVDAKQFRTREIDGRMPQDVNIGFGLLATIHAGSNFSTTREHIEGLDWKTESVHTDINGKALFLKTIARQQEVHHSDFKQIPAGTTVADAVKMLESE
jgi:hypothetical protein